jgi:hypothetical protein
MPLTYTYTYTHPDGRMMRVVSVEKERVELVLGRKLTDDEFRAHIVEVSIPADAIDVHEMPEGWKFPADTNGTFRLAWRKNGMTFSVDMPKAREIWRSKMREARAPMLAALDIQALRAVEGGTSGAPLADIVAKKRALRDVTIDPAIDAAQTPDELRAVWPDCLRGDVGA